MLNIGPFSVEVALVFMAAILAWLVARTWAKSKDVDPKTASGLIMDALLIGALAARLAYVLYWWRDYQQDWWAVIAISDGGFISPVGIVVGLAFIIWRARNVQGLRLPSVGAALIGIVFWLLASVMIVSLKQSLVLPSTPLSTMDHQPTQLSNYLDKPLVVNVWATWCPPCRREMPMFEAAQQQFPELNIVMVNQGEDPYTIHQFLEQQGLKIGNILLDPHSRSMRELGANALPTTLFFDTQGNMKHSHIGELTLPAFKDALNKL